MSIEAMKQALEALEYAEFHDVLGMKRAVEKLSDAIEQAEKQQPVAYLSASGIRFDGDIEPRDGSVVKLYTAPPQCEWVGLTYEEIRDIHWSKPMNEYGFARSIEAKLKEKNHVD